MTGETWSERTLDVEATEERAPSWLDAETLTQELGAENPRWRLVVLEGPDAGRTFEVPPGTVSLGRADHCAIRLGDDAVSRVHLRLEAGADGIRFLDESTKNGTRIDGVRRTRGLAAEGARIEVGRTVLEVRSAEGRRGEVRRAEGRRAEARQAEEMRGGTGGGVVQEALRAMRASRVPRWPGKRMARRLALAAAIAVGAILAAAVAVRFLSPPPRPAVDEEAARRREARKVFDEGLELWRAGDREAAGGRLRVAADIDPESEEPWRYLRRLEESRSGAAAAAGDPERDEGAPLAPAGAAEGEAALPREEVSAPAGERLPGAEGESGVRAASREGSAQAAVRHRRSLRAPRGEDEGRRAEVEELLARASSEAGAARVNWLRKAWERARGGRLSREVEGEVRRRLAEAALEVAEEALARGRPAIAATHLRLALDAQPELAPARSRLAELRERAESFFVEGYSLLEREPSRAREKLELVVLLTDPEDPLHARARRWLERAAAGQ